MKMGKLLQVGNSLAVVIPKHHARQLGWMAGDVIGQQVSEENLVLKNVTRPKIRFVQTVREYGDGRIERS